MRELPEIKQPDGRFEKRFPPIDKPIRLRDMTPVRDTRAIPGLPDSERYVSRELLTANTLATIANAQAAKQVAVDFMRHQGLWGQNEGTLADALPVRLSATGSEPASHAYCDLTVTDEVFWSMRRWRDHTGSEAILEVEDGDSAAFLADRGLRRITPRRRGNG